MSLHYIPEGTLTHTFERSQMVYHLIVFQIFQISKSANSEKFQSSPFYGWTIQPIRMSLYSVAVLLTNLRRFISVTSPKNSKSRIPRKSMSLKGWSVP